MTAGPAPALRSSGASRAGLFSMVLGAHLLALVALLSINGLTLVVERAPMLVRLLPEPAPPRIPEPIRTVPPPQLRKPEIHVPEPPRFEILEGVQVVERPAPPPAPAPKVQPSRIARPEAPPALEPPRFDLAYLDNPAPAYPVFAKRAREQGVVMLRVRVDAAGNVEGVELHQSSGSDRLDNAALAAVRRWRFVPAREGDRAVAGVALVPIHFELES